MGFKKRQQGDIFKFENQGDSLTGYYLGSQDFEGDFGPTKKHLFKTEKGVKVVIGQAYLTSELAGNDPVPAGTLVRITLSGTKKSKKGQPMKTYEIEVDGDSVLDSNEVDLSVDAAESEESDDYESNGAPEVEERVAAPVTRAKGPSPADIARMNALLRKSS